MYFLGIDGGGTKTEFYLCDEGGRELSRVSMESASHWGHSGDELLSVMQEGLSYVLGDAGIGRGDIMAVGFGMAGLGESAEKDAQSTAICRRFFDGIPLGIRNDVEVALIASLGLEPGIHIVAGTGAMSYGMDQKGNTARCGGWGHEIGDEGAGYWLGKKTMELFTKQSDGRLPRTYLYDLVRDRLQLRDDFDIITVFHDQYWESRTKTAALQMILCEAAAGGDTCALQAYRDAARELALLAVAMKGKLDFSDQVTVSYSGGVFKAGAFIRDPFMNKLRDLGFTVCDPLILPRRRRGHIGGLAGGKAARSHQGVFAAP